MNTKLYLRLKQSIQGIILLVLASMALGDEPRPNVLMIIVDDLKPTIGAYEDQNALTPAMDRLSAEGTVFLNAHCQQAVCGASRASALTGLRPDTTQVWDFQSKMRDKLPNLVTLPQYFKQNGYYTASIGKVFDYRCCDGRQTNDKASWSQPHTSVSIPGLAKSYYADPETKRIIAEREAEAVSMGLSAQKDIREHVHFQPTTECLDTDVPDNTYEDGLRADKAMEMLRDLSEKEEPFFLTVGFKKPHLPFVAPKKYWDLYDPETLPLAEFDSMPEGAPSYHFQDSWELRSGYAPIPEGKLPEEMQRRMVHGYYACVSYIDAQVDRLLNTVQELGLEDNTIVLLWGDHGWHLGDHGMWCKHTNYEQATRVPLIIKDPRMNHVAPRVTHPVEFVDMSPTLTELAGLETPPFLEGESLLPLLKDSDAPFKEFAVSQFARSHGKPYNNLMGYAFRNDRYRLILWLETEFKQGQRGGLLADAELYDYQADPLETINLANRAEHKKLYKSMLDRARAFAGEHMDMDPETFALTR